MTQDVNAPPPDLEAELSRLNQEIGVLGGRAAQAHQAWLAADSILRSTVQRRDNVAARLRVAAMASQLPTPPAAAPPSGPAWLPASLSPEAEPAAPVRETSTRTVQNILFVLGGLLLGTAAIVFTAVAWTTFGVQGRAAILAVVTLVALALPFVALWRKLRATAETFAGVGLLLVVLDGWAAWSVNLFGVNTIDEARYAGIVCAITTTIAIGYRAVSHLVGPGFVALVAAQPVLPLLLNEVNPGVAGWSLLLTGVAAMNLTVVWRHRGQQVPYRLAMNVTAWCLYSAVLGASALIALGAVLSPGGVAEAARADIARAAVALVAVGVVAVLGAALTRVAALIAVATGALVLSIVVGAARYASVVDPDRALVLIATIVAATALLGVLIAKYVPGAARPGVTAGSLVATGLLGATVLGMALVGAVHTWVKVAPFWSAAALHTQTWFTWQLPVALLLTTGAAMLTAPRVGRPAIAVAGLVLTALALPSSVALPWWAPPALDLLAAAVLLLAVSTVHRTAGGRSGGWAAAIGAAALAVHAVPASLSRPELTAATLTGIGLMAALLAIGAPTSDRFGRGLAGTGVFVALTAVPPALGSWLVWADVTPWWIWRLTVAAMMLVVAAVAALRSGPPAWYGYTAAVLGAVIWPTAAGLSGHEPLGVYAGLSLLALAITLVALPADRSTAGGVAVITAGVAALPGALLLAVDAFAPVVTVIAVPYSWLSAIWSGVTGGLGLAPTGVAVGLTRTGAGASVQAVDAVALGLLAVASALATYAVTRRVPAALAGLAVGGPAALLVALVAAAAPWPVVPGATLLIGLVAVTAAAVWWAGRVRTPIAAVQGVAYAGAGLAGLLGQRWSTLVGLGLIVVAAAVIGAAGRSTAWRTAGWLGAVTSALTLATAASLAADLTLRTASFWVLAVAIASLALGAWLSNNGVGVRRRTEAVAIEAAAHGGAIVALAFAIEWATYAAGVCAAWGVAVGLRALWPGTGRTARAALAAIAGGFELLGWWLLLAARDVSTVEAYTLPLAGVALLAGWAALRARPDLRSWVAYGPALAAAFLPSLAIILTTTGEPWRRLGLGVAALAVVVAGAVRRLRAPVVVGGGTLIVLAIHEIAVWWELVPGWVPLAIGGVLLVGLAITYERRRRDVARLRASLSRMT